MIFKVFFLIVFFYIIFKVFFFNFFYMIFKVVSKFQFQNWKLGNLWSSSPSTSMNNFKIHPSFWALKKSKHNRIQQAQPNTPTKTKTGPRCSGCTTGPKKKKGKKKFVMSMCVRRKGAVCGGSGNLSKLFSLSLSLNSQKIQKNSCYCASLPSSYIPILHLV